MTRWLIPLAVLALAGCARASGHFLDERTAMVSGRGGTVHTGADLMSAALKKAALMAQQRGFSHFQVVGHEDASRDVLLGNPGSIMGATMPGTDIMVRFYHAHEVEGLTGIWSADSVLAQK